MERSLLSRVLAQDIAVSTLKRALTGGRVHHAYLFDGPDGVGKEMTAFGLAQALLCEKREALAADACGACSACTRALMRPGVTGDRKEAARRPLHPDIVILERGLYEPSQIGRRTAETQDISIDQVRTLVLARAAFGPHEGHAKVFILRRADELSISAANALLKTLEEPGKNTYFVLLTSQADTLLPTIRSRTQRIRFGPLPDDVVAKLLTEGGVDAARALEIARLAGGSVAAGAALADPELTKERDAFVSRALAALAASDLGLALDLAEDAKKQKDTVPACLMALAVVLASRASAAVSEPGRAADVLSAQYGLVLGAMGQLDGNASAQLVMESMFTRMRTV